MYVDQNCDQVCRKITRLLDNGEMKVGEFCDVIGVSSNSLRTFRGQSGATKGSGSDAFTGAWEYFKKREMAGVKLPIKKKAKTDDGGKAGGKRKGDGAAHPDISDVELAGEEEDAVRVYDTCDEVRKKISAYLRKPDVTQAQFCRDLAAQLHSGKKIQSSQLGTFRGNKGPKAGNTSAVFYAAYVFFEKIRIKEGKPKSKHREEMEDIWGPGGFDTETPSNRGFICHKDARPTMNQFGRTEMNYPFGRP